MLTLMKGILKPRRPKEADAAPIRLGLSPAEPTIALQPPASPALKFVALEPAPQPGAQAAAQNGHAGGTAPANPRPNAECVAVLTLSEAGEILSARGDCLSIFGVDAAIVAGRNIARFLQGGLDNDIGRFLQRRRAGSNATETVLLRVVVVRPDGTTFPVSVTTPTWSSDRRLHKAGEKSPFGWTVALRGVAGADAPTPAPVVPLRQGTFGPPASAPRPEIRPTVPLPVVAKPPESPAAAPPPVKTNAQPTASPGEPRRAEFELRAQLDAVREAAGYAEAAFKEEALRHRTAEEKLQHLSERVKQEQLDRENRFAEELLRLAQERDDLQSRIAAEAKLGADIQQRHGELEARLHATTTELESLKAATAQRAEEHGRLEAELRAQLEAARESAGSATAALKEEVRQKESLEERLQGLSKNLKLEQTEWDQRYAEQLTALRQERDDLRNQVVAEQQAAADVRRRLEELEAQLRQTVEELDRVRAAASQPQRRVEPSPSEIELRAQLETAREAATRAGSALQEEAAQRQRLEERLRETDLGQRAARDEQVLQLQREISDLQRQQEDLQTRWQAEKAAAAESQSRADALASRLADSTAEVRQAQEERLRHQERRSRSETALRDQLESEKARKRELEAAWSGIVERNLQFEEELTCLRQSQAELSEQLAEELKAGAASTRRVEELENALEQNTTELDSVRSALDSLQAEHERAQADWRERLESAQGQCRDLQAARDDEAERQRKAQENLQQLRDEHERLLSRWQTEQEEHAEWKRRADDLIQRDTLQAAELASAQAELERERAAREQAEADAMSELETTKNLTRKLEAAWAGAVERNKRLEREIAQLRHELDQWKPEPLSPAARRPVAPLTPAVPPARSQGIEKRSPRPTAQPSAKPLAEVARRSSSPAPARSVLPDGLGRAPLSLERYNLQP